MTIKALYINRENLLPALLKDAWITRPCDRGTPYKIRIIDVGERGITYRATNDATYFKLYGDINSITWEEKTTHQLPRHESVNNAHEKLTEIFGRNY